MSSSSLEEKMMFMDTINYLPNDILFKVDRASMVNSLEVRSPFLNHNVVDDAFLLPNENRFSIGHQCPLTYA